MMNFMYLNTYPIHFDIKGKVLIHFLQSFDLEKYYCNDVFVINSLEKYNDFISKIPKVRSELVDYVLFQYTDLMLAVFDLNQTTNIERVCVFLESLPSYPDIFMSKIFTENDLFPIEDLYPIGILYERSDDSLLFIKTVHPFLKSDLKFSKDKVLEILSKNNFENAIAEITYYFSWLNYVIV